MKVEDLLGSLSPPSTTHSAFDDFGEPHPADRDVLSTCQDTMSSSKYTPDLGATICGRISTGESLRTICADAGMPSKSTVMVWLQKFPEFQAAYGDACRNRVEAYAEEIVEISDDAASDLTETAEGVRVNADVIQRARLRIDTRKWIMSKLMPKKYGDKLDLNHTGKVETGSPIDLSKFPVAMRDAMITALEAELAEDREDQAEG